MKQFISLCYMFLILVALSACRTAEPTATTAPTQKTSPIYWNLDRPERSNADDILIERVADEQGCYHLRFVSEGQIITLQTDNKEIVDQIDATDAMGLILDAAGSITDVVNIEEIATVMASDLYILKIRESSVDIHFSPASGSMPLTIALDENTIIWDVCPDSESIGQVTEAQMLDKVNVYCDHDGITTIFVHDRYILNDRYIVTKASNSR